MKSIGSRSEVMHKVAHHTSGGLVKKNLKIKNGRIVSKKASKAANVRVKDSKFQKFIDLAKKSNSFKLSPRKGTKLYKKTIRK